MKEPVSLPIHGYRCAACGIIIIPDEGQYIKIRTLDIDEYNQKEVVAEVNVEATPYDPLYACNLTCVGRVLTAQLEGDKVERRQAEEAERLALKRATESEAADAP